MEIQVFNGDVFGSNLFIALVKPEDRDFVDVFRWQYALYHYRRVRQANQKRFDDLFDIGNRRGFRNARCQVVYADHKEYNIWAAIRYGIQTIEHPFGNIASNSPIDNRATRKELTPEPELRQAIADKADIGFVDSNDLIKLRSEIVVIVIGAIIIPPPPTLGATLIAPKIKLPTMRTMFKTSERQ